MQRIASLLALAGLLAAAPMAASATTISECQGLITTLQQATDSGTFLGRNAAKDESGLIGKLGEASKKLGAREPKLDDAAQKVNDYQSKLMELLNAGKTDQATFDLLNTGAAGVQTCIADITP